MGQGRANFVALESKDATLVRSEVTLGAVCGPDTAFRDGRRIGFAGPGLCGSRRAENHCLKSLATNTTATLIPVAIAAEIVLSRPRFSAAPTSSTRMRLP